MASPLTAVEPLKTWDFLGRTSPNTFHSSKGSQGAKELSLPAGLSQCPWKRAAGGSEAAAPVSRQLPPLHALHRGMELYRQLLAPTLQ